jgi:hypothetical protein
MRISTSLVRGAVLSAAVALLPSIAKAAPGDMWLRNWTICSGGTFNSCHSVSLRTTDNTSSTAVVVSIKNINGQDPNFIDNAPWSGLRALRFYGSVASVMAADAAPVQTGTATTTGTANLNGQTKWQHNLNATGGIGVLRLNGSGNPDNSNRRIGGCNTGSGAWPGTATQFTCGGQIVYSFSTQTLFSAQMMVGVYASIDIGDPQGLDQNTVNGYYTDACQADPGPTTSGGQWTGNPTTSITYQGSTSVACGTVGGSLQYLGDGSVPEPMTIALLGSGLVGVGIVRRRKKTTTKE